MKLKHGKDINIDLVCNIAIFLFGLEALMYRCKAVDYPKEKCIFAFWHAQQLGVYSCNMIKKTVVMVSNSKDGEIISRVANSLDVETVRGSSNHGGAKASAELIEKIKDGYNGAITIDGPRGPEKIVKKGIVEIAKIAGVPIVPAIWWSPDKTFLKFNSWDGFRFPILSPKVILKCAQPVYLPDNPSREDVEIIRKKIEDDLNNLSEDVKINHKKYWKENKYIVKR